MAAPVVVDRVARRYGAVEALSDVSFRIERGGITGLLGPNGAGKTSLFDLLAGLAKPSSGAISLFGEPLLGRPYPRRRVGVVLQREFIPDQITVREYAQLFAAVHGVADGAQRIVQLARLAAREKVGVEQLSGGEAQRLFVAASLVHTPELLLLDEPSAGLDPQSKRELGDVLRHVAKTTSVLIATHDISEAERLCDSCLFLVGGRLRASGATSELLTNAGARDLEEAFFHYCGARVNAQGDAT